MAPWTTRGLSLHPHHSPSSTQPPADAPTTSTRIVGGERSPSRPNELNPFEQHPYGIPTLHAQPSRGINPTNNMPASHGSSDLLRVPSRKSSHGRSMSHPFPFFSGKKKRHEDDHHPNDASPPHEELGKYSSPSPVGAFSSPSSSSRGPAGRPSEKQLITGKCMTCDTTVRWPKDLAVYRCTVCLTINDLKPIPRESRSGSNQYPKATPLSKDKTRWLIDRALARFLTGQLQKSRTSEDRQSPEPGILASMSSTPSGALAIASSHLHPGYERGETSRALPITSRRRDNERQEDKFSIYSSSSPGNLGSQSLRKSSSFDTDRPPPPERLPPRPPRPSNDYEEPIAADYGRRSRQHIVKSIFKPLEEYLIDSFSSHECINASFMIARPGLAPRADSEGSKRPTHAGPFEKPTRSTTDISELDAKTLLLGDIGENSTWWTGGREFLETPPPFPRSQPPSRRRNVSIDGTLDFKQVVNAKSPRLDWFEMNEWYYTVLRAGNGWKRKLDDILGSDPEQSKYKRPSPDELHEIQALVMEAQAHTQRVLLKATENILKRPGRPLNNPEDIRFLLIMLANPLLSPSRAAEFSHREPRERMRSASRDRRQHGVGETSDRPRSRSRERKLQAQMSQSRGGPGQHSGIIKRIIGLLSNLSNECHHHLVAWFARLPEAQFRMILDLASSFVSYRLSRCQSRKRANSVDPTAGLIPRMAGPEGGSQAALHAALGLTEQTAKKNKEKDKTLSYGDDWQIKAAARVMALLFAANNSGIGRRLEFRQGPVHENARATRERALRHGQIVPTSDFYNSLLDYAELIVDFETWEAKRGKFTFCQYPFFLSIWAKIQIMEYDARRQMEVKAREAFFDSILTHKTFNQYLSLSIRRECLVEDSLKSVSEVVGAGGEEIKKGLRIAFKGEEGIDAGGLRKEWFLLLVRDVFNPEHGMFVYDEDSHFCYFNPHTFETSDQYFLVGVVLGLAIYNSTILDVAFPPFAFRKLLAAGPVSGAAAASHAKPIMTYTLDDLAEYRPALAHGLRQLLEYDGDVEETFCRNFVADIDRYGTVYQVPLCPDGENRPVTNSNRREFVDMYVRYLLDTAVSRQFEPFKRGFFTVCGGNALSLFRPEEIELLIRGSDEALDILSLRAVAVCENWGRNDAAESEPVIQWFWQTFESATPQNQRKLLSFITGSDRIPAMGATNLIIKLSCLGDDSPRFPVARTCFNMLSLYRYSSKEKLEVMLWRAVEESEGFGLK